MKKYYTFITLSLLGLFGCQESESIRYTGTPKDLRYIGIGEYYCGEPYTTEQPSLFTGGDAVVFALSAVHSEDYMGDNLIDNFEIENSNGIISIKEYNDLIPGQYTVDVEVTNSLGTTKFNSVLDFSAGQSIPQEILYMPQITSAYGDEISFKTAKPSVKGGGPYTFRLLNHSDVFTIDASTGEISLLDTYVIDDQDIHTFDLNIEVTNALGTLTDDGTLTIEVVGALAGKSIFNSLSFSGTPTSYGLQNLISDTFTGTVEKELEGEVYTTTLIDDLNTPVYLSNSWRRAWTGIPLNFKDKNGNEGDKIVMQYWTLNEESRSYLVTEEIDLTHTTESAYVDVTGMWRYTGGAEAQNQHLSVVICEEENYNNISPSLSDWLLLDNDISEQLMQYPSGSYIDEVELEENGKVRVDIPSEYLGKKVRVALMADFLNPKMGALARRLYIYQLQVRAK